jgi:hypothetical protein
MAVDERTGHLVPPTVVDVPELEQERKRLLLRITAMARYINRVEPIIEGLTRRPAAEADMWKVKGREWLEEVRREIQAPTAPQLDERARERRREALEDWHHVG